MDHTPQPGHFGDPTRRVWWRAWEFWPDAPSALPPFAFDLLAGGEPIRYAGPGSPVGRAYPSESEAWADLFAAADRLAAATPSR